MNHILIADEMHPSIIEMLHEIGYVPDYQPFINRTQILDIINNYEGLIIRSKTKIDKEFLNHAQRLKFIGRAGAGLDLIDLKEAEERQISIFAANEGNRIAVAEHVMGMILSLLNRLHTADREVRNRIWHREENRGFELFGKTVGIIGFGNNGKETAKRFAAFRCRVLVYDKYLSNIQENAVQEASIHEIFNEADILSLHIPLTDETLQMVDNRFIAQFRKKIYLINAARGEIVVLSDLVKNLKSDKILGACLDVLENEKLTQLTAQQQQDFDYLCQSDKVILTPHIAGWTHESYLKINEVLVAKIQKLTTDKVMK
jgi:D-3-phosphoglycerate dehydrogenase